MAAPDNSPIYDDLMRFKPEGVTPNAWAVTAGVSRTVWSDMRRHGNPSRRTLEKLLSAAGSSLAEFEALRIGNVREAEASSSSLGDRRSSPWSRPELPPLPLLRTEAAGEWGDPARHIEVMELDADRLLDRLPRPASLAEDAGAYAIPNSGHSMWPRFRHARRLVVSPRSAIAPGDDVLVKLRGGRNGMTPVLIKELVSRSGAAVELRQFTPDVTFEVPAVDIAAIEKILGELI
jgi:phage repressor protein C with HTH and peptisase S24 domain